MRKLGQWLLVAVLVGEIGAVQAQNLVQATVDAPLPTVEYKSAKIRWRFKVIKGVLHQRRYNYTTKKWLGKWVKVAK